MPLNFDITIKYYVFIDISGLSIVFIIIILKASMVWRVAYFTARPSSGRSIVPLRLSLRRTKWQFWEFQTIDTNPLTIRVNIRTDFIPPAIDDKATVASLYIVTFIMFVKIESINFDCSNHIVYVSEDFAMIHMIWKRLPSTGGEFGQRGEFGHVTITKISPKAQ